MQLFRLALFLTLASSGAHATLLNSCQKDGHFALTFDDGPSSNTGNLLTNLRNTKTRATFHVTTAYLQDPAVMANLRQLVADGHLLGLRTPPSWNLDAMTDDEVRQGLRDEQAAIAAATGLRPRFVRFPYGRAAEPRFQAILSDMGLTATEHNLDAGDYVSGADGAGSIVGRFRAAVDPIAPPALGRFISAQHSANAQSVAAVPHIVAMLRHRGYSLVDLAECVGVEERYAEGGVGGVGQQGEGDASAASSDAVQGVLAISMALLMTALTAYLTVVL